ncbi:MAG: zinc-ribbon domain-containing protein [Haloarculaceae archaeon]
MAVTAWLAAAAVLFVAVVVGGWAWRLATVRERPREVLPAHYSSLVQGQPALYPGHCTTCGTDNEPGYRFCRECGDELPDSADFSGRTDVEAILRE